MFRAVSNYRLVDAGFAQFFKRRTEAEITHGLYERVTTR